MKACKTESWIPSLWRDIVASSAPYVRIAEYYDELVQQHGYDPRACDYGRPLSQQVKFDALAEAVSNADRSILDVGCGFADWADHLEKRFPSLRYTGIDLSPRMVAAARGRRPDLDIRLANLVDLNEGDKFDFVAANGIFYLLGDDAERLLRELVQQMWVLARRGIAFTTLSSWADMKEAGEYYADPLEVVRFCRSLTSRIVLRHDYHPADFAVYLYRDA